MALRPDATRACLELSFVPGSGAILVECWDRRDHNMAFATRDPELLRTWARDLQAEADKLEQYRRAQEDHICPACNGSSEDPLGPAGEGRCRECHGSGEVTGE